MCTLSIRVTTFLSLLTALRLVHAQTGFFTESATPPTPTSCPAAVSVQNGGFDSGVAPWATLSGVTVNPAFSVVSPGYNGGGHALQLEFQAANVTSWSFSQDIGLQCKGEQYVTSFAANWLNFSIHGNPNTNFCHLSVGSSYCFDYLPTVLGSYNATNTSGWQYHSYTCTAQKTGYATFDVDVGCEAGYVIPAFTWQVTDFDIQLVVSSTSPQPTPSQSIPSQATPAPSQSSNASPSFSSSLISSALSTSSIALSTTTPSSTNALVGTTSSITLSATTPSSTNVPVGTPSATTNSTSSASVSINTTSVPTLIPGNKASQTLKASFLTGPMGLILLLSFVIYQL